MDRAHKVGIIGFGGFGQFLAAAWSEMDEVEVTAIADPDEENLPVGNFRRYAGWQEILKDDDVEIVSVATTPSTHAEIACAALDAGKHLLLEKPAAMSLDEVDRIIAARDRTRRIATVDYMLRFNPLIELIEDWSRRELFGAVRRVIVENYAQAESLSDDHWLWDKKVSGGILVEHAVHFFDLAGWVAGSQPVKVWGLAESSKKGREDTVFAGMMHDNGTIATHYHAFSGPGYYEHTSIRFVFNRARIEVTGWIPLKGSITAIVDNNNAVELERLPSLTLEFDANVEEVEDVSRPEGWGKVSGTASERAVGPERLLQGRFELGKTKAEVYSDSVRAVLADLIRKIEDPGYRMRINIEDGRTSLITALKASQSL